MTILSVNLNKVALLRNARDMGIPSVIKAARTCMAAGASGITVHPRPDQRHIRPSDVYELAEMLTVEFNIEGNPFMEALDDYPGFLKLVHAVKPAQCTLVPDYPSQKTSDHGFDLKKDGQRLKPIIAELQQQGIRVSIFLDPVPEQVELAKEVGADRIELYTEAYARAFKTVQCDEVFHQYARAAKQAQQLGLGVNGGHDLDLHNLGKFCTIGSILEVSIGHAIFVDALDMGLANTVKAYCDVLASVPNCI